jgi:2-iminobutanoate/2-iminopropanoate deaminase
MKEVIATRARPKAIGTYSQAIEANGFIFASGQLPLEPLTGVVAAGDIAE